MSAVLFERYVTAEIFWHTLNDAEAYVLEHLRSHTLAISQAHWAILFFIREYTWWGNDKSMYVCDQKVRKFLKIFFFIYLHLFSPTTSELKLKIFLYETNDLFYFILFSNNFFLLLGINETSCNKIAILHLRDKN